MKTNTVHMTRCLQVSTRSDLTCSLFPGLHCSGTRFGFNSAISDTELAVAAGCGIAIATHGVLCTFPLKISGALLDVSKSVLRRVE